MARNKGKQARLEGSENSTARGVRSGKRRGDAQW